MRTAISPALPILVILLCGWASARGPQAKPPAGSDVTDPTKMAGEKTDSTKSNIAAAPVDSNYLIGPEDVISVWVYQQPSMIGQWVVRTDGMVSIPLIGEIKAGGL